MQLSEHFTLEDALRSDTARKYQIRNIPSEDQIDNIVIAAKQLEYVQYLLDDDLIITSWYRSPALNKMVGGVSNSAHLSGFAIDFKVASNSPFEVSSILASRDDLDFDQLIFEYGRWTHISFDPHNRNQILSIHKNSGYVNGIVANNEEGDEYA